MIIYGSNFGTDSSIVFVKIGGKEAKVINAKGNSLYCITPQQCYEGTIEVKVGEQDVIVSSKYKYVPQKVVSTLCGYVDEKGNGEIIKEGPFSDCGKIDFPAWFEFDPKNHDILYLTQDAENNGNGKPMRILDLSRPVTASCCSRPFNKGTNDVLPYTTEKIHFYQQSKIYRV